MLWGHKPPLCRPSYRSSGWVKCQASVRTYAPRMCDLEVIDSELRLLLAIRNMAREAEGRTPNTAPIDELLDERSSLLPPTPGESPASE
jgi:hypothetical protein